MERIRDEWKVRIRFADSHRQCFQTHITLLLESDWRHQLGFIRWVWRATQCNTMMLSANQMNRINNAKLLLISIWVYFCILDFAFGSCDISSKCHQPRLSCDGVMSCCCSEYVWKRAYHFCDLFVFAVTFTASDADASMKEWRIAIRKNTLTDGLFQSPNEYWQKQEHSLELIDRQFRLNTLHARCAFFYKNLFASFHYVSCCHAPSMVSIRSFSCLSCLPFPIVLRSTYSMHVSPSNHSQGHELTRSYWKSVSNIYVWQIHVSVSLKSAALAADELTAATTKWMREQSSDMYLSCRIAKWMGR